MVSISKVIGLLGRGIPALRVRRAYLSTGHWSMSESGEVADGDAGVMWQRPVQDREKVVITHVGFSLTNGTPIPTNCDLVFIIFDEVGGATREDIVLQGDGNFFNQKEVGANPEQIVYEYENTTGDEQRVGIAVDNGEFNAGTGSTQDAYVSILVHAERSLTMVDV